MILCKVKANEKYFSFWLNNPNLGTLRFKYEILEPSEYLKFTQNESILHLFIKDGYITYDGYYYFNINHNFKTDGTHTIIINYLAIKIKQELRDNKLNDLLNNKSE